MSPHSSKRILHIICCEYESQSNSQLICQLPFDLKFLLFCKVEEITLGKPLSSIYLGHIQQCHNENCHKSLRPRLPSEIYENCNASATKLILLLLCKLTPQASIKLRKKTIFILNVVFLR